MKGIGLAVAAALQLLCVTANAEGTSLVDARSAGSQPQVEPRLFRHLDELIDETDNAREEVERLRDQAAKASDNARVIECLRSPDRQTARARRLAHQLTGLARESARHGQVDDARQLEHRIAFQAAVIRWGVESARECMKLSRRQSHTEVRVTVDPALGNDWLAFGRQR